MNFFNPTSLYKELTLLQEIEKDYSITQKKLGNIIGAAPSMVNVYIDELEKNGYMVREYKSAKTVNYKITASGVKRKNYLLIVYMRELLSLYHLAKNNVEEFLVNLEKKGYRDLLLYGAGEVAETIIAVIRDRDNDNLNILAVIDDDKEKQGEEILGFRIISIEDINQYSHDAVVVTSYTFEEDIVGRLKDLGYDMNRVERFFGVGDEDGCMKDM